MTFQEQPGGYPQSQPPQYPSYPGNYPGGGIDQSTKPPSGGTAITAGVLAALGAVWGAYAGISNLAATSDAADETAWIVWMQGIVFLVELVTLGPGAILMFLRKPVGRWLTAGGSALHIIQGVVALIGITSLVSDHISNSAAFLGAGAVGLVIVLLPAIATLVLALVPLTGRWLAWGSARSPQQPPQMQQPPYPPYQQNPPYPPQS